MHAVHKISDPNELIEKKLSPTPLIHSSSTILDSRFGDYTEVAEDCYCKEMVLGDYSYLASSVQALWCDIGKFSSIASHCVINPGNHPYHRVTQHHCTYRCKQYGFDTSDDVTFFEWRKKQWSVVGHDVWLGHGVLVMPGAKISHGAVVAAGSVVVAAHPVGPYEIAAGVPAKPVKKRFTEDIIARLLGVQYWDWSRERLEQAFHDFKSVEGFLEKYDASSEVSPNNFV